MRRVDDEPAVPPRRPNMRAIEEAGLSPEGEALPDSELPAEDGRTGAGGD